MCHDGEQKPDLDSVDVGFAGIYRQQEPGRVIGQLERFILLEPLDRKAIGLGPIGEPHVCRS